ncbi:hypothetical protein SAMN07250955_101229 [Arboricoccus pini]|uniref:Outer membrane surface antigen n=1 Tax=Arboricoccus pini TaxID=1963835 RepID=A0A212PYX3_9PROT|nr:hypothetical protein [Arboricoccus pini]SNB52321.1 hypothetical protein SAMN07250955_101229 [Arboricoccus pini]
MAWRKLALLILLPQALLLSACGSVLTETTADVAGVGGAAAATALTDNAMLATGIGLGVRSIANAGLQYGERSLHANEQAAIAKAGGPLAAGQVAPWSISHSVPIEEDKEGRVAVSRVIQGPGLNCKELVFSVDKMDKKPSNGVYTTTICQEADGWQWAAAEPSTARWGSLQ